MITFIKYKTIDRNYYRQALTLRNRVLRKPIGKDIYSEDLSVEKDNDFYAALIDNKVVATFSVFAEAPQIAHLTAFAVEPEFQKQGIGSKLLIDAIGDLKRKHFKQIKVNARSTAYGFYQKNGFKAVGHKYHNDRLGIDDYLMIYEITKS
ncbi:GNAT family N-acetyltransferase [Sporolactobacillus shoreicorticis]|uniref:GNAT family N-acetyltransferase n=1 Tax=Sporolactobacillus shoreicorticis TaxID=1923877 RepID=A0ABW5S4E1_9BACL|nr:GNAT family N-acetyltransferase [Sporolactobacillus shoreicorticis]MCO7124378.1 GNAT family N-acetyltransferase [Sporolactobacillus shoreicorticis]